MSKKKKILRRVIFITIFLIIWPWAFLPPYKGKVIDTDTKEPIEGAVVLVVYYNFYPSVAGNNSYLVGAKETMTDANGEFKIPGKINLIGKAKFMPDGDIEIFKPGYGTLWHKRATAVGENKSWPPAFKYVVYEIPKLKTMEERKTVHLRTYSEIPYEKKKNYIRLYNEERINLGYSPTKIIPKKGE